MKRRSPMLIFIAILALRQGALGVFRAFEWFNIGADMLGQGLLILPLVGVVARPLPWFRNGGHGRCVRITHHDRSEVVHE